MFETIIEGIISGALIAGVLELARRFRRDRQQVVQETSTAHDSPEAKQGKSSTEKTVLRLILATFIGIVLGGTTAGVLEKMGSGEIEFLSLRANTLIAFWTALVWLVLSRFD